MERSFEQFSKNKKKKSSSRMREKGAFRQSIIQFPKKNIELEELPKRDSQASNKDLSNKSQDGDYINIADTLELDPTWSDWVLLCLSSIMSSSFAPLMICLGHPILYKLFWYSLLLTIILLILSLLKGIDRKEYIGLIDKDNLKKLLLPSICYLGWIFCMVYASHFNNISHVLVFSNVHSLLIMFYFIIKGDRVNNDEKLGIAITLVGLYFVCIDDKALTSEESVYELHHVDYWERIIHGNLVALIGSIFAGIYIYQSKQTLWRISAFQKSISASILGSIVFLFLSLLIGSFKEEHQGYSLLDIFELRVFLWILLVSAIAGWSSTYLLLKITKIFSELEVSGAMQLQPFWGSMIVYLIGEQSLPGWQTFLGMSCCFPGLILLKAELKRDGIDSIEIKSRNEINNNHNMSGNQRKTNSDEFILI